MFAVSVKELDFDGVLVPPFEIDKGGLLFFEWPRFPGGRPEHKFLSVLRQESTISGLTVFVKLVIAEPYEKRLQNMLVSQVPQIGELLSVVRQDYKERFEEQFHDLICNLPGTMRVLLAMHIACNESQFVAFNSSGLDILGEEALLEYAGEKAKRGWAFLYFRFPTTRSREADKNAKVSRPQ